MTTTSPYFRIQYHILNQQSCTHLCKPESTILSKIGTYCTKSKHIKTGKRIPDLNKAGFIVVNDKTTDTNKNKESIQYTVCCYTVL